MNDKRRLRAGDLILCKDKQNAINYMVALANAGVETDFEYKGGKIYLMVLSTDE